MIASQLGPSAVAYLLYLLTYLLLPAFECRSVCVCVTFVTCEVRVCGLHCRSWSSLYIYRVYLLT